jgi:hypothetical protein
MLSEWRGPADPMGRAVSDQLARHGVSDGGVVRGQPCMTRSDAPGSRDRGHRATLRSRILAAQA